MGGLYPPRDPPTKSLVRSRQELLNDDQELDHCRVLTTKFDLTIKKPMKRKILVEYDPEEIFRLNQEIKKLTQAMVDPGGQDPQLLATKLNATLVIIGFLLENFIHASQQ